MPELLESLENLFMAETTYADAKIVLGKPRLAKKDRQLLSEWVQQGYFIIEINTDGKKHYALSNEGEKLLRQDSHRWYVLQARKTREQKKKLREFLEIIDDKSGKTVPARDLEKFSEQLEKSLQDKAITEVAPQKYCLSAYGKALLLSLHPPGEIIDQLAQSLHQVTEKAQNIRTAQQEALKDILVEEPHLYGFVQQGIAMMEQHLNCALEELIRTQRHLATLEISQQTRERLHQDIKTIRDNFYDAFEKTREEMISHQETLLDNLQKQLGKMQQDFEENQHSFSQELAVIKKLHAQLIELFPTKICTSEQSIALPQNINSEKSVTPALTTSYQPSTVMTPAAEMLAPCVQSENSPDSSHDKDETQQKTLPEPWENGSEIRVSEAGQSMPPSLANEIGYREDNGWGNNVVTSMPVESFSESIEAIVVPYRKNAEKFGDSAGEIKETVAPESDSNDHYRHPEIGDDATEDIEVTVDEEIPVDDGEQFELESEREYQVEEEEIVAENPAENEIKIVLREVRDYYIRTYWHHHGELELKDLFAYLQTKLGLGRVQAEQRLLQLKKQEQILLRQAFHLDEFAKDEVIEYQGKAYFALQIPDLTDI